jgi:hypothetical protein
MEWRKKEHNTKQNLEIATYSSELDMEVYSEGNKFYGFVRYTDPGTFSITKNYESIEQAKMDAITQAGKMPPNKRIADVKGT